MKLKRIFLIAGISSVLFGSVGHPAMAATEADAPKAEPKAQSAAVNPQIGERLLRANSYLEAGKLDDALSVVDDLARVRKAKPVDLAQIHRFRGYILLAKNKPEDAAEEFETALAQNALDESSRQGMMYSLAQIYTQAGKYDRARDLIDRWFSTESNPKAEAYFLKAMILVQQENFDAALEPARMAVEKSQTPHEGWLQLLAAIEFQLQDYASVADTLQQLIAISPGTKRYWIQLATIENTIGKEEEALASLAIAQNGGLLSEDKELRQRARLCFVRELPECCAQTLEQGIASGKIKGDAESYQLLANCYIASRDTDKALTPLAKAGEMSADGKGFLLLGQLLLQGDKFDAARDALSKARPKVKAEQRANVDLLIGVAELGSDHYDRAEEAFRIASADSRIRPAAESYLKHLDQKRALRRLQEPATLAGEEPGTPVSKVSTVSADPSM